jgi:hypothetical protein
MRVFENRVLRKTFGHKREEVTGNWRKLHSEELHDLHSTPSITWVITSRQKRWAGNVACMVLVGKCKGKRTFGRCRHRWEHNTKMNLPRACIGFIWLSLGTVNIKVP